MPMQWTYENIKKGLLQIADTTIPKSGTKRKQEYITQDTTNLMEECRQRAQTGQLTGEELKDTNKRIQKMLRKDRQEYQLRQVSRELDVRDKWLGIKQLKKGYSPQPYCRRNKDGQMVPYKERAETAAKYLAEEVWGTPKKTRLHSNRKIYKNQHKNYLTHQITLDELNWIIRRFKRHKTPGPDEVPIEVFKEMDEEHRIKVLNILNTWWDTEKIPKEELVARVVLIFKKGDSNDCGNYRPISLLNT
eukprot:8559073-Karenia_brevis.AAC.1